MLIGSIDRFLLTATQGLESDPKNRPENLLMQLLDLIGESVSSATSGYAAMTAFTKDVQKYQFGSYNFFVCDAAQGSIKTPVMKYPTQPSSLLQTLSQALHQFQHHQPIFVIQLHQQTADAVRLIIRT